MENYENMTDDVLLSFPWNRINVQINDIVSTIYLCYGLTEFLNCFEITIV